MPGKRETAWSGHAHQILPARKATACAPPKTWPSLVSTRISCCSRLGGMARRAATRGSCKGARAKPRFCRGERKRRARERQNAQSLSKNTQPRAARRPFLSVISEVSEIMLRPKRRPCLAASPYPSAREGSSLRMPPRSFASRFMAPGERLRNSSNRPLMVVMNSSISPILPRA